MTVRLTPRLKYPFPDFLTDPWFDDITAFFLGVDGTNWAVTEDRNLQIHGGGSLLFDATANTLSWSQPILLQTHAVGITWSSPAITVTVTPGQVVWVQVDRTSLSADNTVVRTVTPQVTNVLLNSDAERLQDKIVLGFRGSGSESSSFFWRTGCVLSDGTPSTCLTSGIVIGPSSFIYGENPPEVPNGAITTFSTAFPYVVNKLAVYRDGLRMQPFVDFQFVDATHFIFAVAPQLGSVILVDYFKA